MAKFCADHWAQLRAAIDERRLSELVAKGGEQAARNMASEIRNGPSVATFDPLMAAHNSIWINSLELAGPAVMMENEDGTERCPYCYVLAEAPKHNAAGRFDDWITLAADGAKAQFEKLIAAAKPDA